MARRDGIGTLKARKAVGWQPCGACGGLGWFGRKAMGWQPTGV